MRVPSKDERSNLPVDRITLPCISRKCDSRFNFERVDLTYKTQSTTNHNKDDHDAHKEDGSEGEDAEIVV
jgi:hypothetical protein